ncbi:hypothetical protein [Clostridium phage Maintenon]|nr:hypothetical protein [Clostridium phage Maintenon]DAH53213.1 MAG TPA: hypothetical protein [Caudoviricetes sp.]
MLAYKGYLLTCCIRFCGSLLHGSIQLIQWHDPTPSL